jgi:rhodanese-related sulfurtransferase
MTDFEKFICSMDFSFFATSQHKIDATSFLSMSDAILLDVRSKEERSTVKLSLVHHIPVLEISFHELPYNFSELRGDKFIGIFCSSGVRSAIAFAYLRSMGFDNVKMIEGGYPQLMDAIMPGKLFKHINNK